ncbi:MAG: hypothetical protein IJ729_04225 [Alloprevotella sp.]|nr:hypothetical protein [Alloprevotella sp.]
MKKYLWLLLSLLTLVSCEENVGGDDAEYSDWKRRNEAYYRQKLQEAKTAVLSAQAQYGDSWESHCDWRLLRHYAVTDDTAPALIDTLCVQIVERGEGSGSPLFTDTVRVNYLKRLMPTDTYPEGRVVEHSGPTVLPADIFNSDTAPVVAKAVSDINPSAIYTTAGETTAFLQMHIGDRWRLYIPQRMGYGASSNSAIPAYSTLVVEMRLVSYSRW